MCNNGDRKGSIGVQGSAFFVFIAREFRILPWVAVLF